MSDNIVKSQGYSPRNQASDNNHALCDSKGGTHQKIPRIGGALEFVWCAKKIAEGNHKPGK